jgi:hypothetical protein
VTPQRISSASIARSNIAKIRVSAAFRVIYGMALTTSTVNNSLVGFDPRRKRLKSWQFADSERSVLMAYY